MVLAVHGEREQPEEQPVALDHDRHCGRHHVGGVTGNGQVDLVDIDQLGIERRDRRRVALVVVIDQLDLTPQQPALRVDVILPDLHRQGCGFPDGGDPAGQRHAEADRDRLGGASDPRCREAADKRGHRPCCPFCPPFLPPLSFVFWRVSWHAALADGSRLPFTRRCRCRYNRSQQWRSRSIGYRPKGRAMKFLTDEDLKQLLPAETASFPSPVPTQIVSSEEYLPVPQTANQREVEARLKDMSDSLAKRQGLWRRRFFQTAAGMTAAFVPMNQGFGHLFDPSLAEAAPPDLANLRPPGLSRHDWIHRPTHFLRDDTRLM